MRAETGGCLSHGWPRCRSSGSLRPRASGARTDGQPEIASRYVPWCLARMYQTTNQGRFFCASWPLTPCPVAWSGGQRPTGAAGQREGKKSSVKVQCLACSGCRNPKYDEWVRLMCEVEWLISSRLIIIQWARARRRDATTSRPCTWMDGWIVWMSWAPRRQAGQETLQAPWHEWNGGVLVKRDEGRAR